MIYSVLGLSLGGLSVHAIAMAKATPNAVMKIVDRKTLREAITRSPWVGEKNKDNCRVYFRKHHGGGGGGGGGQNRT